MKLQDRIAALQRAYPRRDGPMCFMHTDKGDLRKQGRQIVVYLLMWADDARVSLHKTEFTKTRDMSVREWADWLEASAEEVLNGNVVAYVNRTFGSTWTIERIVGWHFTGGRRIKARKR